MVIESSPHSNTKLSGSRCAIVAICDTNSDPDLITVPIAGNDDAIKSVELITHAFADSVVEARREAPVREEVEEGESYTYSSDRGAEPEGERDGRRGGRGGRGGGGGGGGGGRSGGGGGGGGDRPRRRRVKSEAIAARLHKAPDAPDAAPAPESAE